MTTTYPEQLDWQRAEILLLDMDGTVLDLRFDNHFWAQALPAHYAERRGLVPEEAKSQLDPLFTALQGQLDWYCVEYWSRELDLDVMGLKRELAGGIGLLPGAETFLQAQQASGRRLWLVTNAHPHTLALKVERTGIERYFERCLTSHELGFAKEDARFWQAFDRQCPVAAQASVMIDDNLSVLVAADAHGVGQCVQITRPDTSMAEPRKPAPGLLGVPALSDLLDGQLTP